MANKRRNITIAVSNSELNAMENFLVCKLSDKKKEKYRKKCIKIWGRLVREWDSSVKPQKFRQIFDAWLSDISMVSKEEIELSQDFCTYLDSHFNRELHELFAEMSQSQESKDKSHNMASCMLSILDSLKLYDKGQLELGDETLSEMMFRKMRGYNVDLNKELGFTHLKPITKQMKKKKIRKIAIACHNVHNVLCENNGLKVIPWEDKTPEHQAIVMDSVKKILKGEITSAEEAHNNFAEMKLSEGWSYAPEFSEKKKTSPRICDFEDLEDIDRQKEEYFFAVASSFIK
jgi:hypothetical protein